VKEENELKKYHWASHIVWYDNDFLGPFIKDRIQGKYQEVSIFFDIVCKIL
jgi:hypothetical protein